MDKEIKQIKQLLLSNDIMRFGNIDNHQTATEVAKVLYEQGYRKDSDIAKEIFERLHQHIKFDGHTVSVWKNDLLCIAKEYGVNLE